MTHSSDKDATLDAALAAVEMRLAALGDALRARDIAGDRRPRQRTASHARKCGRPLRAGSARRQRSAPALRDRLANASGHIAAQRESLARATAALDRAIDVLLPAAQRRCLRRRRRRERLRLAGSSVNSPLCGPFSLSTQFPLLFTVVHCTSNQLSARCTALTLLRAAHGMTCRCSGITCTCSFHSRSAALTSSSRFFRIGLDARLCGELSRTCRSSDLP